MDFRERGWEGVDWIHLVQDRDQWQACVITVIDIWFRNMWISLTE
jgi:hypothetical protein